ncbi:hypothetical protein NEFER03_0361 [Nematocida sp. LUAm3]|nr:hypothetical protein NEFER03_0361 [Nematocida sp. LUAm3]KAI5176023.1 hypothetical protein NEFER02_1869 [Nematocida sp. LUAm2]KAI5179120.1 hypothetical protein NEFER01_1987 [Nematocida sp. LUAm1]
MESTKEIKSTIESSGFPIQMIKDVHASFQRLHIDNPVIFWIVSAILLISIAIVLVALMIVTYRYIKQENSIPKRIANSIGTVIVLISMWFLSFFLLIPMIIIIVTSILFNSPMNPKQGDWT